MATSARIRVGFSKVNCNFLRESIYSHGKKLKDHVYNVEEIKDGSSCKIEALCVRQTSVNKTDYRIKIILDPINRSVSSASCTCVSGKDGYCKHVSAVVHFINEERTESQTDKR